MTAILRIESRKRLRGAVIITAVFALLSAFYFSMFPGMAEEAEAIAEGFPDFMFDFFGIEAIHTIEGFIAAEIYSFFWIVFVGIYFAYVSAGLIAADVRSRRIDLSLSNPISRESVLLQKVAALWVPIVVLNVGVPVIVYLGSVAIDETMNPVAIAMLHLLSIPYLLVCAGIGLVLSVSLTHERTARATALGAVLLLWLVDGISRLDADYEWIGMGTPSRYYEVSDILVHEEYAILDAAILIVAFLGLVGLALVIFIRRDI